MKITVSELKVLEALDASEYGDVLTDPVWTFSVTEECGIASASVAGVVSSLVKKGLVWAGGTSRDATLQMTEAGAAAYLDATGGTSRKTRPRAAK
jgi:hypothetical protein